MSTEIAISGAGGYILWVHWRDNTNTARLPLAGEEPIPDRPGVLPFSGMGFGSRHDGEEEIRTEEQVVVQSGCS